MRKLSNQELNMIVGGSITISSALLKAFISGFEVIIDAGRNIGSSLRRLVTHQECY